MSRHSENNGGDGGDGGGGDGFPLFVAVAVIVGTELVGNVFKLPIEAILDWLEFLSAEDRNLSSQTNLLIQK